jgi:hypothetical protein
MTNDDSKEDRGIVAFEVACELISYINEQFNLNDAQTITVAMYILRATLNSMKIDKDKKNELINLITENLNQLRGNPNK